ncbi:hypothetical protein [Candidatus Regiella insecticola]|uniref:hypothetical protein n=1 Tax=Candidatus Regiella insecticola TaxID=138073 RepID=UPI0002F57E01|nr:hypothetical protein [Candidatus Regiella insecticola]
MAHQRIYDTTREKPALRLIDERKALQVLPPKISTDKAFAGQQELISFSQWVESATTALCSERV